MHIVTPLFVELYQIIQLGHHMDCIIQHRGIRDIQKQYQRFHFHRSQISSLLGQTMSQKRIYQRQWVDQLKHLRQEHQKGNIAVSKANMDQTMHCNVTLVFFFSNLGHLGSVEKSAIKLFKIGISRISETNTECPSWYVRPPTRPPFIQLKKVSTYWFEHKERSEFEGGNMKIYFPYQRTRVFASLDK